MSASIRLFTYCRRLEFPLRKTIFRRKSFSQLTPCPRYSISTGHYSNSIIRDDILEQFFPSTPIPSAKPSTSIKEQPEESKDEKIDQNLTQSVNSNFNALLHCLKQNEEFTNPTFLLQASYFARKVDDRRRNAFIELVGSWWKQAKVASFRREYSVSGVLFHLGSLNKESGGALLEKLDGLTVVNHLLGRLLDIGLDTVSVTEMFSVLRGLEMLAVPQIAGKSSIKVADLLRWEEFGRSVREYFARKKTEIAPGESTFLADGGALECLRRLQVLDIVPADDTLKYLNDLSISSLKLAECDRVNVLRSCRRLYTYAALWTSWRINPNTIIPNSWSLYYDAFSEVLTKRGKTQVKLSVLAWPTSVAAQYACMDHFSRIYDQWYDAVLESLRGDTRNRPAIHSRGIAGLLLSVGMLSAGGKVPEEISQKLTSLADELLEKLCSLQPTDVPYAILNKALVGYKEVNAANRGGVPLSDNVNTFLRRWCVEQRKVENERPDASYNAASIFFILTRGHLNAPEWVLEELTKFYFWGFSHDKKNQFQTLFWYGLSCRVFNYDPSRDVTIGERIWPAWFRKIDRFIEKSPSNNTSDVRTLVVIAVDVASAFRRIDEFRRIQPTWERVVVDQLAKFSRTEERRLRESVRNLKKEHGIRFDSKIMDVFGKKEEAGNLNPKV